MIYIFIIVLLIFLSLHYDINGKTKYKNVFFYVTMIILILIAGLRWRLCMDTPNYIYKFYYEYPLLKDFSFEDYPIGKDPAWVLINSFIKSLNGKYYWVQLFEATVVNLLVFRYIKKHSSFIFTCLFFYVVTCYVAYSMEIMRAAFSVVICLYANDFILERKWVKAYLLYILALLFHAQTILMFIVPLLFFLRFNIKGIFVLILAFWVGYISQVFLGDFLSLVEFSDNFSNKASNYVESDQFGSQSGNVNFYIVKIIPPILYSLFSLYFIKYKLSNSRILVLEPFVMTGLFFLVLQLNMQIAYRYVDYFRLIFVIFYAESFVIIAKKIKTITSSIAYTRALIVFLPFFLLVGYSYYSTIQTIYPYSSVIDRKIDSKRESYYSESFRPSADIDEY